MALSAASIVEHGKMPDVNEKLHTLDIDEEIEEHTLILEFGYCATAHVLLADNADEASTIRSVRGCIINLPVFKVFAQRRCSLDIIALLLVVSQPSFGVDYKKG